MERAMESTRGNILTKNKYAYGFAVALASAAMSWAGITYPHYMPALAGLFAAFAIFLSPRLSIIAVIVFLENMFFALPSEYVSGRRYVDAAVLVVVIMNASWLISKLKEKKSIGVFKGAFSKQAVSIIALAFIASFTSMRVYSQPLDLGLRASRSFLIFAAYFPLRDMMKDKELRKWTVHIVMYSGFVICCAYMLQYVFIDSVQIFDIQHIERLGQARLRIETGLIVTSFFIALSKVAREEQPLRFVMIAALEIAMLTIMLKTRTVILGLLFAASVFWFFQKRYSRLFLVYFAALFLLVNGVYMQDSLVSKLYKLTIDEISKGSGNYDVRVDEMDFYMSQAVQNPVLGRGVLNELHPQSYKALGTGRRFYLSDIGVFAYFFYFGAAGIAWAAAAIVGMALLSARAARERRSYVLLMMSAYLLASMPTIFLFESPNLTFYALLAICMSEGELEAKETI